jgi:hypothetical protein
MILFWSDIMIKLFHAYRAKSRPVKMTGGKR